MGGDGSNISQLIESRVGNVENKVDRQQEEIDKIK